MHCHGGDKGLPFVGTMPVADNQDLPELPEPLGVPAACAPSKDCAHAVPTAYGTARTILCIFSSTGACIQQQQVGGAGVERGWKRP